MENHPKLLSVDADAKTVKGRKQGFLTGIMYFAPAEISGHNVCAMSSAGCRKSCLGWYAGRVNILKAGASENTIQKSRLAKTNWYFDNRATFMVSLVKEIEALIRKAKRENLTPVVRLNGSSDIPWERVEFDLGDRGSFANIMIAFPNVQFYDYTKIFNRAIWHAGGEFPSNYHLTFSLSEENLPSALEVLKIGGTVAAVFFKVPATFKGYEVTNGDATDLRFGDASGTIAGLKAKGDAKRDRSGFVQ